MTLPWTTNETQTHITLQKQVVVKPHGVSMATTAACICGVSPFNPYIPASGGSGRKLSPCGVSPWRAQASTIRWKEMVSNVASYVANMSQAHGVMGEIGR